jgi:Domain of unknown function (DUF4440)
MRSIVTITTAVCGMFLSQTCSAQDEEVVAAKESLEAAYGSGNVEGIRSGTTTDHIAIAPHWEFFSQAQQLAALSDLKVQSYEMHDMKTMQLTKDVVVLTFRADIVGTYQGKKLSPQVRVVETWVKREGTWLQATYQETQVDKSGGP